MTLSKKEAPSHVLVVRVFGLLDGDSGRHRPGSYLGGSDCKLPAPLGLGQVFVNGP